MLNEVILADHVSTQKGFAFKSAWFTDSGRPLVKVSNFSNDSVKWTELIFVPEGIALQYARYELRTGDVLIQTVGSWPNNPLSVVGKTVRVPKQANGALLNQNAVKLVPRSTLDGSFLFYLLRDKKFAAYIVGTAQGAANQAAITLESIRAFTFALPPIEGQRRIASILSSYDDLIENNTRRIAILEEMARRLYEEWFVRFRFPGHEGVPMVESELGLVPLAWQVTTLGQFAEVNARSVRRGAEPTEIHYVDISSVSTGTIDKKERMLFADAPGRARRIVRDGDVIWACVRPNRKSYSLVLNPEPNLLVSTGFAVLSPVDVPCSFLYQCVTTKDFVSHLVNHAKGATYPAVSAADFDNAKVLRPSDNLVVDFDKLAEPMMRLVAALQLKNANLRTTRDLLLPKLISGELDVSTLPEPLAKTI
jgi:type I restriction enzyme S subunit